MSNLLINPEGGQVSSLAGDAFAERAEDLSTIYAILDLGNSMLSTEIASQVDWYTANTEEGKNPNSECPHGNDIRQCTVCNSRDGSPKQHTSEQAPGDTYELIA